MTRSEVIAKFIELGAVHASMHADHGNIVYFWDIKRREIGYMLETGSWHKIFAPNYREWSQESLDNQRFESIANIYV